MSQYELAAALGIAYQQLYKYEQAKNRSAPAVCMS
jgi:transcriptional regulator with XRE-family HTH domain